MKENITVALLFLMEPLNFYKPLQMSLEHIVVFYDYYKYIPLFLTSSKTLSTCFITRFFTKSCRISIIYNRFLFENKKTYSSMVWPGRASNLSFYLSFFKKTFYTNPSALTGQFLYCWYSIKTKRVFYILKEPHLLEVLPPSPETLRVFLTNFSL